MLELNEAAEDTIAFLKEHGFCPERAARLPLCAMLMLQRVQGKLTDKETRDALSNLDILSGGALRPKKEKACQIEKE